MHTLTLEKLVHGGQAIGTLPDGRRVFVWNGLPGEEVKIDIFKNKKKYAEAIATEVLRASPERTQPKDEAYLSTSPWQICSASAELRYKKEILQDAFIREKVALPAIAIPFYDSPKRYNYRNKMEYSFWSDDDQQLHLALFYRGSRKKRIVTGSSIALPVIDETARRIRDILNRYTIHASRLKTVVIRANQNGDAVAALFVKDEHFPEITELSEVAKGTSVYFSNPNSPASVATKELYRYGSVQLTDNVAGHDIAYDVNSFFQVNIPVFSQVMNHLRKHISPHAHKEIVDMYAGVGTIARLVSASKIVEIDQRNIAMAKRNNQNERMHIVHASAEESLKHIPERSGLLIVDPPRAGLHASVRKAILERCPQKILYLSCNPSTQARDVAELMSSYKLSELSGYNFFPVTPHIESLAILDRR